MGALARAWLRSRKVSILLVLLVILLVVYYFLDRETILEKKLTRSTVVRVAPVYNVAKLEPLKYNSLPKLPAKKEPTKRDDIIQYVENSLQEALKVEKGTGCNIPKLDPFAPEITKFDMDMEPLVCSGTDWVSCKNDKCKVVDAIRQQVKGIECRYRDLVYESDARYELAPPKVVRGGDVYTLVRSDHAEVSCVGHGGKRWEGVVIGLRDVNPKPSPVGREHGYNVLIMGFDSTSKNGFIRRMPESHKVLKDELGAVVLNGYNIVGDGTPAALFPILTGFTELELPEVRKRVGSQGHLDSFPFLWYTLHDDGYRTLYFEDMPQIGTFQYRFTGFQRQPADHYLRPYFLQYHNNRRKYAYGNKWFCVGDTPSYIRMMNATSQYMNLDRTSKKFAFTFVADITHDDFNFISNADEYVARWLRGVKSDGLLEDTLLIVMGDHGPRYANVRNTLQGKLEERLPMMSFVLPESFVRERPEALANLRANSEVLTTPFDVHNTLLEFVGLSEKLVTAKVEGADLPRSMSLLHKIPPSRSCSEAAIEPHWCTCLKWTPVDPTDEMFKRVGQAFLDYINKLTQDERSKCVPRTITSIDSVSKWTANANLLAFNHNKDVDGYLGSFDAHMKIRWQYFELKVTIGPGMGIYEASLSYDTLNNQFNVSKRDISRINAYNDEPSCVSATRPDLNMYCYCKT